MAIHWQVKFKTLRGGKTLTASVYDNLYSGEPIALKGGAEPFVTDENDDDDPFKVIRVQTGSLRIVDDGKDANGNTFNWRDLQPRSDHDRPVILRDENNVILWQGFLQAQNFSGTLYEETQEREFPIQCALSILSSQYPNTADQGIVNFAYLLNYITSMVSAASLTVIAFTEIIIQGGADARSWLLNKFYWVNLLSEDKEEGMSAQYDLYTCLEDMCNFWGWQARTEGTRLYLMCAEDPDEQTLLTLTPANLATLAAGTSAGTVSNDPFIRKDLTGNIFASNDNEDMWMNGPSEITVTADCNEQSALIKFAPPYVEKELGDTWTWVAGADNLTGYFTTPTVQQFGQQASDPSYNILSGTSNAYGGFCRRQIFSSNEQEKAAKCDMIYMHKFSDTTPCSQIQYKKWRNYGGGSISLKGSLYDGEKQIQEEDPMFAFFRIGIGLSYTTAKWYKLTCNEQGVISHGWGSTQNIIAVKLNGSNLGGFNAFKLGAQFPGDIEWGNFSSIPVDLGLNGYLFIDFMGIHKYQSPVEYLAELADFEIDFSRDQTIIVDNTEQHRPRTMSEDRVSSMDYTALNENSIKNQQDIDLVYASDNNMKFGYGLVMTPSFTYVEKVTYGQTSEHPEQHFADRIANFWAASKRIITADLQTNAVEQTYIITPRSHLVIGALHYRTLAINHQWRDDVTTVKMIQSLILIEDEEEE